MHYQFLFCFLLFSDKDRNELIKLSVFLKERDEQSRSGGLCK